MNCLEEAKKVFETEIQSLKKVEDNLDDIFVQIIDIIKECKGKIILCGMGKSGHIAKKISATMASLGTPSFFLHPAEAMHGDLGMVSKEDIIILISHSGESEEIIRLLPSLKMIGVFLIAITANADSILAKECNLVQIMPDVKEACSLNLAPTSSTTSVLVYGDALAVVLSKMYGFQEKNFALLHPAGSLGKKILVKAADIMVKGQDIPIVNENCLITEAIMEMSKKGLGFVIVIDEIMKLVGILTDGDLRRAIEKKVDMYSDKVKVVMTKKPKYITEEILAVDVLQRLRKNSINNYPIVDDDLHVIGALTWQMIIKKGIIL